MVVPIAQHLHILVDGRGLMVIAPLHFFPCSYISFVAT